MAIQRYAGEHTYESTTATVSLNGDEDIKGRIIGREGRNVRAFEAATGVTVLIDDTPNSVVLSGFDPVKREIAMTGEVTITGQVLPIGGLKEKLLAAHRAGIKEVLIPKENEKDLVDMPKKIVDEIKITPVEYADEVLKIALTKELKKTEWVEVDLTKKDDKSQASIQ